MSRLKSVTRVKLQLSPPKFLALSFFLLIMAGTLLLYMPFSTNSGQSDLLTALFTATSASCVTGLIVVDTATHWSVFGQVVILLLIQVGGLGIMSFAVFYALVLGKKIQFRQRLIMQQALNKIDPGGVVNLFRSLLLFTFISEAVAAIVLAWHWSSLLGWKKAFWFGLFHSISAFNNAGFDLWGNFRSLTFFVHDPVVNLVICGLIIIGGLGFVVVDELFGLATGKKKSLSLHSRVVVYTTLVLITGGTLILLATEYNHSLAGMPLSTKCLASLFQSISPRTAGFNTIDFPNLLLSSQLLIALLMVIGGSPGSTAGGMKTSTVALLMAAIRSQVLGKKDTEIHGYRIAYEDILRALTVAALYIGVVITATFILTLTEGAALMPIMFEVCSAVGTVGLTLGVTTGLSVPGQLIIAAAMFLGRVGPLTLAFALAYNKKPANYRYPAGKVMIG
ncbi:MAG: TrkH family potassium uptake protein [Syntrophomonadaceae bacterium]